jgi:hypothetical protein
LIWTAIKNGQSKETGNIGYTRRRKTNQKHNRICVEYHYAQRNTNNENKTWALLQTTGGNSHHFSYHPIIWSLSFSWIIPVTFIESTKYTCRMVTFCDCQTFQHSKYMRTQSYPRKLLIYIGYTRRRKTNQKHNRICVEYHYAQRNTNNENKTW